MSYRTTLGRPTARLAAATALGFATALCLSNPEPTAPFRLEALETGSFRIEQEAVVAMDPAAAFDEFTGDISGWWDHHFASDPKTFVIEPKPGGRFIEIIDDAGNGILHATVTWSHRGEKLIFRGPLGAHGRALDMVHTVTFSPVEDGTRVAVEVRGVGDVDAQLAQGIDQVWHHFLVERFKPFVDAGGRAEG